MSSRSLLLLIISAAFALVPLAEPMATANESLETQPTAAELARRLGVEVHTTLSHPTLGLVVGTFGQGLWIQSPAGEWRHFEATLPGATDSLPGNYIHALNVASNGDLLVACSWGGLDRRFMAHERARQRGLITEKDPHDFLRASLARFDGEHWSVQYLFQNYRGTDHCELAGTQAFLREDIDGDGHEELVLWVDVMRQLHGKGWMSIDLETLEMDWFVPAPAPQLPAMLVNTAGGKKLVGYSASTDQGAVVGEFDDSRPLLYVIDGFGEVERVVEIPYPLAQLPLRQSGPSERGLEASDSILLIPNTKGNPSSRSLCWALDLGTFRLSPGDSLTLTPTSYVDWTTRGKVAFRANLAAATLPELYDPADGRTIAALGPSPLEPLMGESGWSWARLRTPALDLGAAILGNGGFALWTGASPQMFFLEQSVGVDQFYWSDTDWQGSGWIYGWSHDQSELSIWKAPQQMPPLATRITLPIWSADQTYDTSLQFRGPIEGSDLGWNGFTERLAMVDLGVTTQPQWIDSRPVDGKLRVLDSQGNKIDDVVLPPGLIDERNLSWLTGVPPVVDGRPMPALVSRGCPPWTLYFLDREQDRWRGPVPLAIPFIDLHANAITAIADDGNLVGTESGVRFLDRKGGGVSEWPADASERVRALHQIDESRVVARGDSGEKLIYLSSQPSMQNVLDLASEADTLYALQANGLSQNSAGAGWESVANAPLSQRNLPRDSHFLPGPAGLWYQQFNSNDSAGYAARGAHAGGNIWEHGYSPFYVEGNERFVHAILEIDPQRWLGATDWGLILVENPLAKFRARDLLEQNTRCLSLVRTSDEQIVASLADGRVIRIDPDEPESIVLDSRSRPAERAVLELQNVGEIVWARTGVGLERWTLGDATPDQAWHLPDSLQTTSMAPLANDDIWLGTNRGVWRLGAPDGDLVPVAIREIASSRVDRLAFQRVGSITRLAVLSEGQLFEFTLPADRDAEARIEPMGPDIGVAIWSDGPDFNPGVVALEIDGQRRGIRSGDVDQAQRARYSLPSVGRGRHLTRVIAYDRWGRRLEPDFEFLQTVRASTPWANFCAILLPIPLLAVWAFDPRRARGMAWVGVIVAAAIPVLLHYVLLYDVPWTSAGGIASALLLGGVVTRSRRTRHQMSKAEAVERLWILLSAFRHRGLGGWTPLDQLLSLGRNLDEAMLCGQDVESDVMAHAQDFLDATQPLSEEIDQLMANIQSRSPLLRRFRGLLEELRDLAASLLIDEHALESWMSNGDVHLAIEEAGSAFDGGLEHVAKELARHRAAPVSEVLAKFAKRQRGELEIELALSPLDAGPELIETELVEVLENLERNAMRAMSAAGVTNPRIRIELNPLHKSRASMRFEDNGPGIAPELREAVFERGVSTTGSTGTGLYRCRELVTTWGATIRAVGSGALGGACFEIEFAKAKRRSATA